MQRRNNNVKKQSRKKRSATRLGETVRIASLLQKGIMTGRSNYVEMRALARLNRHNVKSRVQTILSVMPVDQPGITDFLSSIPAQVAEGYTDVLTPNGKFESDQLDRLLAIDAEITTSLSLIESQAKGRSDINGSVANLQEILKERKELVQSLKA